MTFADYLHNNIKAKQSFLLAGLDPRPSAFPDCFKKEAISKSSSDSEMVTFLLQDFYGTCLPLIRSEIVGIKPNSAFFEEQGLAGLKALKYICSLATELRLPIILDVKRGDIGSTAEAYANAYLGKSKDFSTDAITVNPFLGFDSLEPFVNKAKDHGKGIFVLVKTSNLGSKDIQAVTSEHSVTEKIANWLADQASILRGSCGLSGLGAVVGATNPKDAVMLRSIMPSNFFLIPGYGAQGATAKQACAGLTKAKDHSISGGVINASRALFFIPQDNNISKQGYLDELLQRAKILKRELNNSV